MVLVRAPDFFVASPTVRAKFHSLHADHLRFAFGKCSGLMIL